jgi:hypothetical protein
MALVRVIAGANKTISHFISHHKIDLFDLENIGHEHIRNPLSAIKRIFDKGICDIGFLYECVGDINGNKQCRLSCQPDLLIILGTFIGKLVSQQSVNNTANPATHCPTLLFIAQLFPSLPRPLFVPY